MRTKEKKETPILERLRKIRDHVSKEIQDMSHEELMAYFKKKEALHPKLKKGKAEGE